jgi:hypothetical protein
MTCFGKIKGYCVYCCVVLVLLASRLGPLEAVVSNRLSSCFASRYRRQQYDACLVCAMIFALVKLPERAQKPLRPCFALLP